MPSRRQLPATPTQSASLPAKRRVRPTERYRESSVSSFNVVPNPPDRSLSSQPIQRQPTVRQQAASQLSASQPVVSQLAMSPPVMSQPMSHSPQSQQQQSRDNTFLPLNPSQEDVAEQQPEAAENEDRGEDRGGREPGATAYTKPQQESLLQVLEWLLPRYKDEWEQCANEYNRQMRILGEPERSTNSIREKFCRLHLSDVDDDPLVIRAREIYDMMCQRSKVIRSDTPRRLSQRELRQEPANNASIVQLQSQLLQIQQTLNSILQYVISTSAIVNAGMSLQPRANAQGENLPRPRPPLAQPSRLSNTQALPARSTSTRDKAQSSSDRQARSQPIDDYDDLFEGSQEQD